MRTYNLYVLFLCFMLFALLSCKSSLSSSSSAPNSLLYFDNTRPSLSPRLFAENVITKKDVAEFGSVFNKIGDEFYFAVDAAGKASIWYTEVVKGHWIEPVVVMEDATYSFNDPFLSPDESKLYYISDMPRNENDTIKDYDIWYSERKQNGWSDPINAGPMINSDANEYYISFTQNGAMYFASNKNKSEKRLHNFDIYKSEQDGTSFQEPQKLSTAINTKRYEADVFIAPNESYIIFCSYRKEGYGNGDLYISFKDQNGEWTLSKNMGSVINSESHEFCPFVTADNKYFFYTSNQDIYWVSTAIIENLRKSVNR